MEMALKSVGTKTLENGVVLVVVEQELTLDDGSIVRGRHVFPDDTMEWRAAEYGIDPADTETLLDMVLWEPHLPDPDRPELLLHDAPDIDSAREYHLKRIAGRKGRPGKPQTPGQPDPIREQIKAASRMNQSALELKKVMVDEGRKARGMERAALARMATEPVTEAQRVARLEAALTRPRGRESGQGRDNGKGN